MVAASKTPTPVLESLTVADVAVSLKVAESTVRSWIDSGLLPRFSPAGTNVIRILRSDFDAFVDSYTERVGGDGDEERRSIPTPKRDVIAEGSPRVGRPRKSSYQPTGRKRGRPPGSKNKAK